MNPARQKLLTFTLPVLFFLLALVLECRFPQVLPGLTGSEFGLVENLQLVVLLAAMVVAAKALITGRATLPGYVKLWLLLALAGATYTFLEEASFGQHYFGWATPDSVKALNDQQETNFHNMSSWLDQKPRTILEIGIIIGGILIPLLRKVKSFALKPWVESLLPTIALLPVALLAEIPRMFERVVKAMQESALVPFARTSEMQELYFYYFILLYLVLLVKASRAAS